MRIHPEGVETLYYIGLLLLIPLVVVLRFSNLVPSIYGWLLKRGLSRFPADTRNRRQRKKLALTTQARHRQEIAFWCLVAGLAVWTAINFLLLPEAIRLSGRSLLSVATGLFWAGLLAIFLGPVRNANGRNWSRWTFLISVITTAAGVAWLAWWVGPNPKAVVGTLVIGAIAFIWVWGFFRRVDFAEAEIRELGIDKSYDGTAPIGAGSDAKPVSGRPKPHM